MKVKTKIIEKGLDEEWISCPNCGNYEPVRFKKGKLKETGFHLIEGNRVRCSRCKTVFEVIIGNN